MSSSARPPSGPTDPRAPDSAVVDRALSCRSVLWARAGSDPGLAASLDELEVRRCPVGPILAIDCPEWAGVACRMWAARGDGPPTVVGRDEAAALLAALAEEGTLSERYRRRLRPLTAEGAVPPPGGEPRVVSRVRSPTPPIGVPADHARRRGPGRPENAAGGAP